MILLTILIFILILGLLIFVHELGHFLAAKRAGMRVEEFGFGFPPRLFGIQRGETVYSINLVPLGGFVKILGESGEGGENPQSFVNKPKWQRFQVLIAGVVMNFLLAWLLFGIGLNVGLPTVLDESIGRSARVLSREVSISLVAPGSPAAQASLRPGDVIEQVGDRKVTNVSDVQQFIQEHIGQAVTYEIRRGERVFHVELVPRESPPQGEGPVGVGLLMTGRVSYPWYEAIGRGFSTTVGVAGRIIAVLGQLIGQIFTGEGPANTLSGPLGIAFLTRDIAELGALHLVQFTALLSINLAILNAVPFPALDGGRVLFLAIETIRRKRHNVKFEQIANTIGFAFLMLLMVAVTVRDVTRFQDRLVNIWQRFQGLF